MDSGFLAALGPGMTESERGFRILVHAIRYQQFCLAPPAQFAVLIIGLDRRAPCFLLNAKEL
jgi:hypothetical protein